MRIQEQIMPLEEIQNLVDEYSGRAKFTVAVAYNGRDVWIYSERHVLRCRFWQGPTKSLPDTTPVFRAWLARGCRGKAFQ